MLSGNEAIALGAWEAGVAVGCGYPGTPSTEIMEALVGYPDIYTEWSINEKVALEVALGASVAGVRALATMKHVGVNVAADPLFTAAYTGVRGGVVIITADDPDMHSSQNEQDNRNYAIAAKIPMLEPSDAEEAREFTQLAFDMSEAFDTPVFLRTTTRLSHSKCVVEAEDVPQSAPQEARRPSLGFARDPRKYVMIPANARVRRTVVERRMEALRATAEIHPANTIEMGTSGVGVITSGIPYTYVKEVLPDASVLKLGLVHPLPRTMIEEFAAAHQTLYVVEELDPVIENQLKAWGIACVGKDIFPSIGEYSPSILRRSLGLSEELVVKTPSFQVPIRRPGLCPGCPHDFVFTALHERKAIVSGDIGCYTLGSLPPYDAMDTCLDMGASITMAHGMDAATRNDAQRPTIAAVIGDSTFAHSGITGLLNAVWNKRSGLFIVLDNGTTAMTGTQPNPLSGERLGREDAPNLNYLLLAKAFNIPEENVRIVDAYSKRDVDDAIDDLLAKDGVRLMIAMGLCVIEAKDLQKIGKLAGKKALRLNTLTNEDYGQGVADV